MASTAMKTAPMSATQVDKLGERWKDLKTREAALEAEMDALRGEIMACVERQGQLADRSSKTRMVEGSAFELRVTVGENTSIDQKAAKAFLEACPRTLGVQVFRREEKLVLIQTPDRLEGGAELPIATRRLFQEAVKVKPKSPSVEVRSRLAKENQP